MDDVKKLMLALAAVAICATLCSCDFKEEEMQECNVPPADWPKGAEYVRCRPVIQCDYEYEDGRSVQYGYAPNGGAEYYCMSDRPKEEVVQ